MTPFDRDAERSVLGAMMLDPGCIWDAFETVRPGDFHDPQHQIIADAVHRLASRNDPADPIMVEGEIAASGERFTRGAAYLFELTSVVSTSANVAYHAAVVAGLAQRRRLLVAAERVRSIALDRTLQADAQVEQARAALDMVATPSRNAGRYVRDILPEVIEELDAGAEDVAGVPTPWESVTRIVGGLRGGNTYVVGARPGKGKSMFAMNLAVGMSQFGRVGFCALEMSEHELVKRLLSQVAEVRLSAINNAGLDRDDWVRVSDAKPTMDGLRIKIDDQSETTVARIRGFARDMAREGDFAGLIVDYVQLLSSDDPRKTRQQIVGEFSRGMKLIAKEFDVPVVILSQLNRKVEERPDQRPILADLRESGDLEQDATAVFLLSRDESDPQLAGEVLVDVAKNRHGKPDVASLAWQGHYSRMLDIPSGW